ncbi:MAG: trypsin-like peptidase domain-containing protein, partial [Candidatus Caenarcaniphilales bacterium]|nr:trypsin-like peptidase domain-containing protein [Candidatus Caenarcaniphilales bacterium]
EEGKDLLLINKNKDLYPIQKVLWTDKDADLAIIQIAQKGFKPVPLASYKSTSVGEKLTIISHPKGLEVGGLENTLSEGLLSSVRENFLTEREESFNPKYDRENPVIFNSKKFFDDFNQNCKLLVNNTEEKMLLYSCVNDRLAIIDENKNGSVIFDNFDLAVKVNNKIYFFENKTKEISTTYKFTGSMIQYTAPISSGSSGGPIFNENGEAVAVVNSFLEGAQNVNYGRPIDYIPDEFKKKNELAVKSFKVNQIANSKTGASIGSYKDTSKICNQGNIQLNDELFILKCGPEDFVVVKADSTDRVLQDKDFIIRNFLKTKKSGD